MIVVLVSLAAALAYAIASVLQQHAAAGAPAEHNLRLKLVTGLARRPLWIAGISASGVGLILQTLALGRGSLTIVQPLLVCGLLFALPINALAVRRRPLHGRQWWATGAVCAGLALFLVVADPSKGSGAAGAVGWSVVVASALGASAVLVALSTRTGGPLRAALQAAGGGVVNGLSAAFTKGVARVVGASWHEGAAAVLGHLFSSWELYALAASTACVLVLVQSAFQSGPLAWSLPALTALNPLTSVAIGVGALGEQVRAGALALLGECTGLALVVAGIFALAGTGALDLSSRQRAGVELRGADPAPARP